MNASGAGLSVGRQLARRLFVSFVLGGLVGAGAFVLLFPYGGFFACPLGGLTAALVYGRGTLQRGRVSAAAILAALGFGLAGLLVFFSMISLQARVDIGYGALAWGFAFGLAGAMAAPAFARIQIPDNPTRIQGGMLTGAVAFALAGAAGGAVGFLSFRSIGMSGLGLGLFITYLLGGFFLGLARSVEALDSGEIADEALAVESGVIPQGMVADEVLDDRERNARASALSAVVALMVLAILSERVRIPLPGFGWAIMMLSVIPSMLGIREDSHRAIFALVALGLYPLIRGLLAMRRPRAELLEPRFRWMAGFGLAIGLTLPIAALLLAFPSIARRYEEWRGENLVASADTASNWDAGNRIHHGNLLRAQAAWGAGRRAEAREFLLAAGRTPGSPQLDSFGPRMGLAREMLQAGERETVLEYLELCRNFWGGQEGRLDRWIAEIKEGRISTFDSRP